MSGVLITQGTQTNIQTDTVGTTNYQVVKLDRGAAGVSSLFTGTIDAITNIAGGTVGVVGSLLGIRDKVFINSIDSGTVDIVSQTPPNRWGTTVSTGTTTLGTIKPAIAGSAIFVTDLIISAGSATTVVLGMGGTSTPLMGTLSFGQYGGLVSNFRVPGSVTSGSALVYQQSVGCSLSITATGFVR